MDKNKILSMRFYKFAKYLRIVSAIALITYIVLATLSKGEGTMVLLTYTALMVVFIGILQSVVLMVLAKFYENKANQK